MAVLNRDDYLNRIKGRLGEELSDEDIGFLEDMTDTYDDIYNRVNDTEDWKARYEENDANWRKKYVERFNGGDSLFIEKPDSTTVVDEEPEYKESPMNYEDLFKSE